MPDFVYAVVWPATLGRPPRVFATEAGAEACITHDFGVCEFCAMPAGYWRDVPQQTYAVIRKHDNMQVATIVRTPVED